MTRKGKATSPKLIFWVGRLQFAVMTVTVLAFLGFVFADNIANRWQQALLRREMAAAGLDSVQMVQRPLVGFDSVARVPTRAQLTDGIFSPVHDTVWLTDKAGVVWRLDVSSMTLTEQLRSPRLASAAAVALTTEGEPLVAVPDAGYIVPLTVNPDATLAIAEEPLVAATAPYDIAAGGDGLLYVLNGTNPPELIVWNNEAIASVLYARPGLHAVAASDGRLLLTGDVRQGRPVVHLSKNGVDITDTTDLSRLWALPYWDVPFVDVVADDQGFITLLDINGHVIQLDPRGTALLQLPSREPAAVARSLALVPQGLLVVYDDAVELLHLRPEGAIARQAVMAGNGADYERAIRLWHEPLSADPYLGVARRLLGDAYMGNGDPVEAARQYFYVGQRQDFNAAVKLHTKQLRQNMLWTPLLVLGLLSVILSVLKLLLTTEADGESN